MGTYYYYKNMIRLYYPLTKYRFKRLGLYFICVMTKENDFWKEFYRQGCFNRLSKNVRYNFKRTFSFDSFLKNRVVVDFFPKKGFIQPLNRKKSFNYVCVDFLRYKKLLNLKKKRPFFFKVNNFLSQVLISKKFPIIFKGANNNLKKKFFSKEIRFRGVKANRKMLYFLKNLRKEEFEIPRKMVKAKKAQNYIALLKSGLARLGLREVLFLPLFFQGYVRFSDNKNFEPLQLNAFMSSI